nr:DnaB-like helicase N-terminal domain-containing protein [Rappaport israeli]
MDEMNRVKEAPKSREAEQSVIGALLLDNLAWERLADKVQASDFFFQNHRIIFSAMMALASQDKPFDVVTLVDYLRSEERLEEGGGAGLYPPVGHRDAEFCECGGICRYCATKGDFAGVDWGVGGDCK